MKISLDEVRVTATLARLALTEDELVVMARELDSILVHIDVLAKIDVEGVEPMTHAVALPAPLRADELGPELSTERGLAGAAIKEGNLFVVPKVVEVG